MRSTNSAKSRTARKESARPHPGLVHTPGGSAAQRRPGLVHTSGGSAAQSAPPFPTDNQSLWTRGRGRQHSTIGARQSCGDQRRRVSSTAGQPQDGIPTTRPMPTQHGNIVIHHHWQRRSGNGTQWRHRRAGRAALATAAAVPEASAACNLRYKEQGTAGSNNLPQNRGSRTQGRGAAASQPRDLDKAEADALWAGNVRPRELRHPGGAAAGGRPAHGGRGAGAGVRQSRGKQRWCISRQRAVAATACTRTNWAWRWLLWLILLGGLPATAGAVGRTHATHRDSHAKMLCGHSCKDDFRRHGSRTFSDSDTHCGSDSDPSRRPLLPFPQVYALSDNDTRDEGQQEGGGEQTADGEEATPEGPGPRWQAAAANKSTYAIAGANITNLWTFFGVAESLACAAIAVHGHGVVERSQGAAKATAFQRSFDAVLGPLDETGHAGVGIMVRRPGRCQSSPTPQRRPTRPDNNDVSSWSESTLRQAWKPSSRLRMERRGCTDSAEGADQRAHSCHSELFARSRPCSPSTLTGGWATSARWRRPSSEGNSGTWATPALGPGRRRHCAAHVPGPWLEEGHQERLPLLHAALLPAVVAFRKGEFAKQVDVHTPVYGLLRTSTDSDGVWRHCKPKPLAPPELDEAGQKDWAARFQVVSAIGYAR